MPWQYHGRVSNTTAMKMNIMVLKNQLGYESVNGLIFLHGLSALSELLLNCTRLSPLMPCFVLYLLGYYSIGDYYIIVCLTQRVTEI